MRADKMFHAALEATLLAYLQQDYDSIPALRMMRLTKKRNRPTGRAVREKSPNCWLSAELVEAIRHWRRRRSPAVLPLACWRSPGRASADELPPTAQRASPVIARVEEGPRAARSADRRSRAGRDNNCRTVGAVISEIYRRQFTCRSWRRSTPSATPRARPTNFWISGAHESRLWRHPVLSHVSPPAALQPRIAGAETARSGNRVPVEEGAGRGRAKFARTPLTLACASQAFRNYADYMLTEPFQRAAAELILPAEKHAPRTCAPNGVLSLPPYAGLGLADRLWAGSPSHRRHWPGKASHPAARGPDR